VSTSPTNNITRMPNPNPIRMASRKRRNRSGSTRRNVAVETEIDRRYARAHVQSFIVNGGRNVEKREEPTTCPTCGGERRDDRRPIVFEEADNMVESDCEDPWHEPKIHERSAHIELET
jgi:hypothetical protein